MFQEKMEYITALIKVKNFEKIVNDTITGLDLTAQKK